MVPIGSLELVRDGDLAKLEVADVAEALAVPVSGPSDLEDAVCVMGVFDGMHQGHAHLISMALTEAQNDGRQCIALTFDVDPDDILRDGHMKLMDDTDRLDALASSGVDGVLSMRFDHDLARLSPMGFLDAAFGENVPSAIFVGEDFRFGSHAAGDVGILGKWADEHSMAVHAVPLLASDSSPVTSTRIRDLLSGTDVASANRLLGHPYAISGEVVHGASKGAEFGFKTANLSLDASRRVLADGVYAASTEIDGVRYPAAVSIGIPPTFEGERDADVEAHILGFDGDLYGKRIQLEMLEYLRPMMRFDDIGELTRTVKADIERTRSIFDELYHRWDTD